MTTKQDQSIAHFVALPVVCAWCLKERGEEPKEGDSHGICERHTEQMLAAADAYRKRRKERQR